MTTPSTDQAPPDQTRMQRFKGMFTQFSRPFWLINGIELAERGAFYSLAAVLAVYLKVGVGLTDSQVGTVFALLFPLLYFVPLVAAALAEKYGYKASLIASFVVLIGGYILVPLATGYQAVLLAVTLIGIGAGMFKPIAAAVVAQSTTEQQRNFAFTIYYGGINLGAFAFPLTVGLVGVYAPQYLNTTAFIIAVALSVLNLIVSATAYRNLRPPEKQTSIVAALARLKEVFTNPTFLILIVIFSGFWFMYAMNQTFLPVYVTDYGVLPSWFNIAIVATINPLTIILLSPLMGKVNERLQSLPLIMTGIAMYVVGFSILGFTSVPALFVLGIVIFSAGELLAQPSFLSYVSKLAPPDRVAVYLGYAFIPVGIGLTLGSFVGGIVYESVSTGLGQPKLFWALMATVGLITIALFGIYNMWMVRREERNAPVTATPKKRGFFGGPAPAAIAVLLIPALIFAGSIAGTTPRAGEVAGLEPSGAALDIADVLDESGTLAEGDAASWTAALPATATGTATFSLTWSDETPGPGQTNAPDTFRVTVVAPDGSSVVSPDTANAAGGDGSIDVVVDATPGDFTVIIELVDAGDLTYSVGPLGVPAGGTADAGNAFTLTVKSETA